MEVFYFISLSFSIISNQTLVIDKNVDYLLMLLLCCGCSLLFNLLTPKSQHKLLGDVNARDGAHVSLENYSKDKVFKDNDIEFEVCLVFILLIERMLLLLLLVSILSKRRTSSLSLSIVVVSNQYRTLFVSFIHLLLKLLTSDFNSSWRSSLSALRLQMKQF